MTPPVQPPTMIVVYFTTPAASLVLTDVTEEIVKGLSKALEDPDGVTSITMGDGSTAVIPSRHVRNLEVRRGRR